MHSDRKKIGGHEYTVYGANLDLIRWVLGGSALVQDSLGVARVSEADLFQAFGADTDEMRRDHAKRIIAKLWDRHGFLGPYPFLGILSDFEVEGTFHRSYRDHVCHQLKVYLLGLFAYDRCQRIRKALDREMGEDGAARFPVRWLITAVYHDIGYVLENEPAKMRDNKVWGPTRAAMNAALAAPLSHMPCFRDVFVQYEEMALVDRHNLPRREIADEPEHLAVHRSPDRNVQFFDLLTREAIRAGLEPTGDAAPLRAYWDYAAKNASEHRGPYYDHGIASALLLLRGFYAFDERIHAMVDAIPRDNLLQPHDKLLRGLRDDIVAHRETVRAAAAAMALHNVYPKMWNLGSVHACGVNLRKFRLKLDEKEHETPLAFLLGLVDTLQDWDRPRFRPVGPAGRPILTDQDISITAADDKLLLHFPADLDGKPAGVIPGKDSHYGKAVTALEEYLQEKAVADIVGWVEDPEGPAASPPIVPAAVAPVGPEPSPPARAAAPPPANPPAPSSPPAVRMVPAEMFAALLVVVVVVVLIIVFKNHPDPVPSPDLGSVRDLAVADVPRAPDRLCYHDDGEALRRDPAAINAKASELEDTLREWEKMKKNGSGVLGDLSAVHTCIDTLMARFSRAAFQPMAKSSGWTIDHVHIKSFIEGRGDAGYWSVDRIEESLSRDDYLAPGVELDIPRTVRLPVSGEAAFWVRFGEAQDGESPVPWTAGRNPHEVNSTFFGARLFSLPPSLIKANKGRLVLVERHPGGPDPHCLRTLRYAGTDMRFNSDGQRTVDLYFGDHGAVTGRAPEVAYEVLPAATDFVPEADRKTFRRVPACQPFQGDAWTSIVQQAFGKDAAGRESKNGWHCHLLLDPPLAARTDGSPLYLVYVWAPYRECRGIEDTRDEIGSAFGISKP